MRNAFSVGVIETYRQCPLAYRFAVIDRRRPTYQSGLSIAGTCYSKALAMILSASLTGRIPSLKRIPLEAFWKNAKTRAYNPVIDDFSEKHLFDVTRQSLAGFIGILKRGDLGMCEKCDGAWNHTDRGNMCNFHHTIPSLFRRLDGRNQIVRHRFGPGHPEIDSSDPWIFADAFAARDLNWQTTDRLTIYFPWFDTTMEVHVLESALDAWWEEISGLIGVILSDETYRAHPGRHCLRCPFHPSCPEGSLPCRKTKNSMIHDPLVRIADHHRKLQEDLVRIRREIHETRIALIEGAQRTGRRMISGPDGKPLLRFTARYRLPSKGTQQREELERLLSENRYPKPLKSSSIIQWMNEVPLPKKVTEKILACLDLGFGISPEPNLPAPYR
jgi:hypothetical protein